MRMWSHVRSWMRAVTKRSRMESEMDAELRFHIEAFAEDLVRSGVPRVEALRRARIEFGGLECAKEECRESRGVSFFDSLAQDLRFGLRMLRKNPWFTAVAVLTLALGIGASTAIFSVVESVLWRPLPFPDPERLTASWSTNLKQTWRAEPVSAADYLDWRAQNSVFSSLAAFDWSENHTLTGNGGAERVRVMPVSANFFDTLQVRPAVGRTFRPDEEQTGKSHVALISHALWERRFQADPTVLEKAMTLDGEQYAIAGVFSPQFHLEFEGTADVYIPLVLDGAVTTNRADRKLGVVGRLKPDVTLARAGS